MDSPRNLDTGQVYDPIPDEGMMVSYEKDSVFSSTLNIAKKVVFVAMTVFFCFQSPLIGISCAASGLIFRATGYVGFINRYVHRNIVSLWRGENFENFAFASMVPLMYLFPQITFSIISVGSGYMAVDHLMRK